MAGSTNRVPDRENAGVEHAKDIACISLIYDLAFGGHKLLRLRQAHFFALDMENLHARFELSAGTDAHERNLSLWALFMLA